MKFVINLQETIKHLFHPRRSNNHRPRVLHPEAYLFFGLMLLVFVGFEKVAHYLPGRYSRILGFESNISTEQTLQKTNEERRKAGLEDLKINPRLSAAALAKGQDMMNDQYWAHIAPDGKEPWDFINEAGYDYQVAGENLARDFNNTDEMVAAWMASPTHRANILNPRYDETGIAVIDGELLGYDTALVVQMFGTPQVTTGSLLDNGINAENLSKIVEIAADNPSTNHKPAVLAGAMVPVGSLDVPPLFSPLELSKAFFLSLIMILSLTLAYDQVVIGNRGATRMVGKNLAHILYFIAIAFLVLYFKAGVIG